MAPAWHVAGADDEAALRKAGLRWRVLVGHLVEQSRAQRAADRRFAARTARAAAIPSGRTTYRTLADYNAEMKALAEQNPTLVRLITLPNKTYLGKDVMGIEITTDVNAVDGKPAFLNMGIHHAREWPSGEHAMEWAYELINGFKNGDARATNIVRNSRNIVVPVVNPDGFEASRTAGSVGGADGGRDESVPDTAYRVARRARVQVTVLRGKRVVKRFDTRTAQTNRTHRLRLGAKGLRRGDYRVRLSVRAGAQRLTSTLVSRRL